MIFWSLVTKNSSDSNFYLDKYLYYYTSNNNISFNLTNEVNIGNNIFGYIFSNCDNLYIYSSSNNKTIIKNYTLKKKRNYKIRIKNPSNFNNFTCILKK